MHDDNLLFHNGCSACRYAVVHMSVHRKNTHPYFTEQDLVALDEAILAFQEKFMVTVAPLMPCKGNTIKWHKLSHLTNGIRRIGAPKHENAQFMEQRHAAVKAYYNGGCKRPRDDADIQNVVRKTRVHGVAKVLDVHDLSVEREARETAYTTTARDGRPHMVQTGHTVHWKGVSDTTVRAGPAMVQKFVEGLKAAQPEVTMLPELMQNFSAASDLGESAKPPTIKVVKTACIPAKVGMLVCMWLFASQQHCL